MSNEIDHNRRRLVGAAALTFVASQFAFGDKAEALRRDYQPGQEVTAVGIPHELQRTGKDGRTWIERQLYLVQLPKRR